MKKLLLLTGLLFLFLSGCGGPSDKGVSKQETTGEFTFRMNLTEKRLTGLDVLPVYTDEFILADVNISKERPRRFDNYSGDVSGR